MLHVQKRISYITVIILVFRKRNIQYHIIMLNCVGRGTGYVSLTVLHVLNFTGCPETL